MTIFDRMTRYLNKPMASPIEQRAMDYYPQYQLNKPQWPRRNITAYSDNAFAQIALIFRCVGVTANSIAAAPVKVYKDAGGGQREEDPTHAVRQLMIRPNPFWGEVRFLSTVAMVAAVTGFCVIEKERSAAGRVIALYPLRSDWLKPIPRSNAAPDWEYCVPGYPSTTVNADDVLVFTYADASDYRYTGIGPLEVALREWGILNTMTDFLKAFFDSGATPQLGLVPDPNAKRYSQAEADTLIEKFLAKSGLANSLRPVFLQGITDVKRLGFDFNELAYTDLRDVSELAVCQAFGVPPGLVGTSPGLDSNTYSNAKTMRQSFYEDTITPLWARLDDTLTFGLLSEFEARPGYSLEFDTSNIPALQDDVTPTWQRATAALQASGITRNMFLREVGLPTVVGGDVFLESIATVEVPAVEEGQNGQRSLNGHATIEALSLAKGDPLVDPRIVEALQDPGDWRTTGGVASLPARATALSPTSTTERAMYRLPAEQRSKVATHAKQTIARLGDRAAPLLRAFWKEQGQRALHAIGLREHTREADRMVYLNSIGTRAVDLLDWDEEARLLRQEMTKVYAMSGKAAFNDVSDLLSVDVSFDLANPNVGRVLTDLAQRVVGITDTTRTDVQRVIGDSLNEGVTLSELGDRLSSLFVETYANRADTVGRTESMIGYNKASVLGYQESGVVGSAELVDNPDHTEDYGASDGLTCATRDGIIVSLDSVDDHIEAEHPNGSLAVIPVLSTALGGEE
jgi:HK97 family phage portal protein